MHLRELGYAYPCLYLTQQFHLEKKSIIDKYSAGIFIVIALVSFFTNISTILLVLISAVAGVLISKFIDKSKKGEEKQ